MIGHAINRDRNYRAASRGGSAMLQGRSAHIIVLGNEKGGCGKSTVAIHLVVGLMRAGYRVACLDLDGRQQTLTRFLQRRNAARLAAPGLSVPDHRVIRQSGADSQADAQAEERERLAVALAELAAAHDFVVIDGPGSDTHLARLAHTFADTLITPVNDSLIDLDPLVAVSNDGNTVEAPGHYAEMVWDQRRRRLARGDGVTDWIVMRNRLSHLDARNKRRVHDILHQASFRYGFRVLPGFGERVIYRELFVAGLTVLDLDAIGAAGGLTMSHVAARQEVRGLIAALRLNARSHARGDHHDEQRAAG